MLGGAERVNDFATAGFTNYGVELLVLGVGDLL